MEKIRRNASKEVVGKIAIKKEPKRGRVMERQEQRGEEGQYIG